MKTVGIICEYNPFHNGHLYQINKAKELTGADYVVAIMSGNFVQRGTPAIIDKHTRTKICLENNIDLVIELPVHFSTASAEFFAEAAINILDKMNIIDFICFGCEHNDLKLLNDIADFLLYEPDEYARLLKFHLSNGLSFPKSRENALIKHFKNDLDISNVISSPNNILAIEYLKAIKKFKSPIIPFGIKRIGSGYNEQGVKGAFSSATSIRNYIRTNPESYIEIQHTVPYDISDSIRFPIYDDDFSILLGQKLIENVSFDHIFDITESLGKRINNLKNEFISYLLFSEELKTKNTTLTSINRALIHILLDIKKSEVCNYIENGYIYYLRILGFKKTSSQLLNKLKASTKLPIISKFADFDLLLDDKGISMLKKNLEADNLYRMVLMNKYKIKIPNEYKMGIIINS